MERERERETVVVVEVTLRGQEGAMLIQARKHMTARLPFSSGGQPPPEQQRGGEIVLVPDGGWF